VGALLAALVIICPIGPAGHAHAAPPPAAVIDEADRAELRRIERYLNSIRTLRSRFAQNSSTGEVARGEVYLSRPGRMRVEYQPPVPVLVVADGRFLIYYDRKLEQVSYVPLGSTPASILLEKEISLSDPGLIVAGLERVDDTVAVEIIRKENPGEGSLTLIFRKEPVTLLQWSITDAQGVITVVTLIEPEFNGRLDPALFQFVDPRKSNRETP
jgi:outer membrane lipoprotein-sorting protein